MYKYSFLFVISHNQLTCVCVYVCVCCRQLTAGKLQDQGVIDGSKLILVPVVESGLAVSKPKTQTNTRPPDYKQINMFCFFPASVQP